MRSRTNAKKQSAVRNPEIEVAIRFANRKKEDFLVDEFVVDDGSGQWAVAVLRILTLGFRFLKVCRTDNAPLAKHIAVFLARNLFGHLKDHLDQSVHR